MNILEVKARLYSLGLQAHEVWYLICLWVEATEESKQAFEVVLAEDTE